MKTAMKQGSVISAENHILRCIFNKSRSRNDSGDFVNLAYASALSPRIEREESGISVTWIECFNNSKFCESLYKATKSLCDSLIGGRRNQTAMSMDTLFAFIKIEDIVEICDQFGIQLEFSHTPSKNNKGHVTMEYKRDGLYLFRGTYVENQKHKSELIPMFHSIVNSRKFVYLNLEEIIRQNPQVRRNFSDLGEIWT